MMWNRSIVLGLLLCVSLAVPVPFDIAASELLYLFSPEGVRIDQQGYHGHPGTGSACFGRCPNGVGPSTGYDWGSSGGGGNLLVFSCTPGGPNPPCTTDVPDEPSGHTESWGSIKARFARAVSR